MKKQWIKEKSGRKVGILVAHKDHDEKVVIGFSQCCKNDHFDKYFGEEIASRRAYAYKDRECVDNIPFKVAAALPNFVENCAKYFKGSELPEWTKGFRS